MFLIKFFLQRLNRTAMFFFSTKQFLSNYTDITVFDIIAVLFLSLALSILGKITSYLKGQPTEYCA